MYDLKKANKALLFAVRAHAGQKMQYPNDVDYSAHIFGVALTAINFMEDKNLDNDLIVVVALLHDTLEDTSTKYEDLAFEFGKDVADGVLALTKNSNLSKGKQMEDSLNRILRLNKKEIAIVKLADRCFNTNEKVPTWPKEKQLRYLEESKLICEKIGHFCLPLKNKILDNLSKLLVQ